MKIMMTALISFAFLQSTNTTQTLHKNSRLVSIHDELRVPAHEATNAFQEITLIAADNFIPLGVVIGDDRTICEDTFTIPSDHIDVYQLFSLIESRWPAYSATIKNNTINITPKDLSFPTSALLPMHIEHFESRPQSMSRIGVTLWMFIRGVIAPSEGTAFAGSSYPGVETVDQIKADDKTVQELLNAVVDKGSGGIWVWNGFTSNEPLSKTLKPYEVYGYKGQETVIESLSCPKAMFRR